MSARREIAIIGAALDLGQGRRGVDMGPSAIRYAGLEERLVSLGYTVRDEGNVETAVAEATALRDERARFLPEIHDTCELIAARVVEATWRGALPLVLGGDHSVALGTLGGLASVHGPGGVLWIDAHSDINTPETSPSGNVHGMALAAALGSPGTASRAALAAAGGGSETGRAGRHAALDEGERRLLREAGVRVFTMSEIDGIGVERVMREALDRIAGAGSCTSPSTWTCSTPRRAGRRDTGARRHHIPRGASGARARRRVAGWPDRWRSWR